MMTTERIDPGEGPNGDFARARRKALMRGVLARMRGDRGHRRLPSWRCERLPPVGLDRGGDVTEFRAAIPAGRAMQRGANE